MLSWLGLTGGSNKASTSANSKTVGSGYTDGTKTMPLSAGRKKGFLSNLDDGSALQEKSSNGYGMKDDLSRGGRSSISAFPPGSASEMDEKAALRAQSQESGREAKVRLPAHVPRSKEEEWELTKNVWSNLTNFVIHDPNFVPGTVAAGTDSKHAETPNHEKVTNGSETAKDGSGTTTASPESAGGTNNNSNNNNNSKSRTHLEESVKRSLHPKVTLHETEEYERYTRQFKSIRFDSVPTKGAAAYGTYMHATPKEEGSIGGTGPSTATASNTHQQQQQPHLDKNLSASDSSSSTVRPSLLDTRRTQNGGSSTSSMTIETAYLDEEEEEEFSGGNAARRSGVRTQILASSGGDSNHPTNSYGASGASTLSPLSPVAGSPALSRSETTTSLSTATNHAATATGRQQPHQTAWNDTSRPESEDYAAPMNDYLPEPPILAPMQTIIKPPSDSEMVLYNAHVELPKLTLYTVGQTSLDPYWGASSGTKARYEAYKMWIHKGRYGHMSIPTITDSGNTGSHAVVPGAGSGATANGAGTGHGAGSTGGKGSKTTEDAVFTGVSNGSGSHQHPPLRRGSSAIYPTVDEKAGPDAASPTIVASGKDMLLQQHLPQHQHMQTTQQKEAPRKERRRLNGFGFSLG